MVSPPAGSDTEGDVNLAPTNAQSALSLINTQAPGALGYTKGITSVTTKPIYFNGSVLAVLYVKHVLIFKLSTISDCPALEV